MPAKSGRKYAGISSLWLLLHTEDEAHFWTASSGKNSHLPHLKPYQEVARVSGQVFVGGFYGL